MNTRRSFIGGMVVSPSLAGIVHTTKDCYRGPRFFDMRQWDLSNLDGPTAERWVAGIDAPSKIGIASVVCLGECGDGAFIVSPSFYIPEGFVSTSRWFEKWYSQGFLKATKGNVLHLDRLLSDLNTRCASFGVTKVAYDPWQIHPRIAGELANITMVESPSIPRCLSAPLKALGDLVASKKICHISHPVLRWMADCTRTIHDSAGNIYPTKPTPLDNITGIIALTKALSLMMVGRGGIINRMEPLDEFFALIEECEQAAERLSDAIEAHLKALNDSA